MKYFVGQKFKAKLYHPCGTSFKETDILEIRSINENGNLYVGRVNYGANHYIPKSVFENNFKEIDESIDDRTARIKTKVKDLGLKIGVTIEHKRTKQRHLVKKIIITSNGNVDIGLGIPFIYEDKSDPQILFWVIESAYTKTSAIKNKFKLGDYVRITNKKEVYIWGPAYDSKNKYYRKGKIINFHTLKGRYLIEWEGDVTTVGKDYLLYKESDLREWHSMDQQAIYNATDNDCMIVDYKSFRSPAMHVHDPLYYPYPNFNHNPNPFVWTSMKTSTQKNPIITREDKLEFPNPIIIKSKKIKIKKLIIIN